ncbi:hypothetical protein KQI49_17060 [Virgibacillus sp. MSJ-26]|uniref:hypothetical protein n=1 Tax=Virgibacillus sp. MSJ-26 TaxID=2841522 RepID=UPI001C103EA9|nr:hypothetical protein [Virgibacillus sp. MSJ-26]MBU5468534.1 hypothetical protein [Virgibacillus sp. MSJ-26]
MYIRVENCFHWIGFHLINRLLEEGYTVIGKDNVDTPKKEFLSMFVARNDSFSLNPINKKEKKHLIIEVCNTDTNHESILKIIKPESIHENIEHIVYAPYLIGEWMPAEKIKMNEKQKEKLLQGAASIEDFVSAIYQWVNINTYLPSTIRVLSRREKNISNALLENFVYLRDNRSIQNDFNKVLEHYQKFQTFY